MYLKTLNLMMAKLLFMGTINANVGEFTNI